VLLQISRNETRGSKGPIERSNEHTSSPQYPAIRNLGSRYMREGKHNLPSRAMDGAVKSKAQAPFRIRPRCTFRGRVSSGGYLKSLEIARTGDKALHNQKRLLLTSGEKKLTSIPRKRGLPP